VADTVALHACCMYCDITCIMHFTVNLTYLSDIYLFNDGQLRSTTLMKLNSIDIEMKHFCSALILLLTDTSGTCFMLFCIFIACIACELID